MNRTARGIGSREALIEALATGTRVEYLRFFKPRPLPDGRIGASCLSQWWPSPFTVDGVEYATAEHWMMAAKARLFDDPEGERRVLAAEHPAQAQKAGRLVRGFDETLWRRERFGIVLEGSVHKFAAHADLRDFLLRTGERSERGVSPAEGRGRVLVEASPVDRVWGIGLAADAEGATDPARWRGSNLLGFALMEARARLRARASGTSVR
ncbi:NADAR family protein [Streptomyces sp. CHD11]|uniref:NADAR family protein n=1 Tax=Streptomyces sp. CHD11 TaxID=2741325 RepID=UPI001BFC709E|nr:NADAR family protein [Streptomyces sp. CHD11]MBT3152859.1 NADAR family protein [Streptomyces sp. CHD11]